MLSGGDGSDCAAKLRKVHRPHEQASGAIPGEGEYVAEDRISVSGLFVEVAALKIRRSNVFPFISDEFLVRELSRHGPFQPQGTGGPRWRKKNHRGKEK